MKLAFDVAGSSALRFVLIMGVVNLFGDVTYEGGAAINGQFLGMLGASAAAISIIAGAGEFAGYALRPVAGWVADRTRAYWAVTFVGYAINLCAVPAMALAGSWELAGALIIAERVGRAIRKPTVEAMISYTTGELGRGWAFGLNTALDEAGATLGPLIAALILFMRGDYRTAYALLTISVVLAIVALVAARLTFPVPERLERGRTATAEKLGLSYWLYMVAGALFAAGLLSYELGAFHLERTRTVPTEWIPVLLAFATGSGVISNLILGRLYDRSGKTALIVGIVLSACFAPVLLEGGDLAAALIAMPLWGIGYAVQDTLMKAIIAGLLPEGRRGLAFGLFYTAYGGGWLLGSVAIGLLYDRSTLELAVFAAAMQLASLPLFLLAGRRVGRRGRSN
ncbi:MFS transporter [Mesorhizobium sp. WSM4884]|uniref:MFS transporter n=1 Tax=Mesorhizobium sp. WSM4884 TaxID=3038542 RepID=UPI002415E8FC|nr:MFS transporter [Mesorhizobium sp. WSM4884]MDG4881928.1 MFS transporter [Mesorhizobium sp. WSM4884]